MAKSRQPRDTYKYYLKQGNRIVHIGVAIDWKRREKLHHQEFPASKLKLIGNRSTREGALRWEREQYRRRGGKGW